MILFVVSLQANECVFEDLKLDKDIVFGFFNGVQTTEDEAREALKLIQAKFIGSDLSFKGESIEYTLFYNKTEGLADFAETFEQRAKEHAEVLADKYTTPRKSNNILKSLIPKKIELDNKMRG